MPPFSANGGENEDCLTLNVWATPNATDLPVFVWIREFLSSRPLNSSKSLSVFYIKIIS